MITEFAGINLRQSKFALFASVLNENVIIFVPNFICVARTMLHKAMFLY
jgi:hypothetical protein